MKNIILTKSEQKTFDTLLEKSGMICSRDEIAQSVWGNQWLSKYSDWQIDRLIYLLRKKLSSQYKIKTLRNSGYILEKKGVIIPQMPKPQAAGTLPTRDYLEYMNDPKNPRKVLKDLFAAFGPAPKKAGSILVINSYSLDNIDSANKWVDKNCEVYFTNFDESALAIHRNRAQELRLNNFHIIYDDIRDSLLKDGAFDLIINDFRLNFNTSDKQNVQAMQSINRLLTPNGRVLISVVIDPRDKSGRLKIPWTFIAQEDLRRFCFTPTYYERLFVQTGFKIVKEFDTEAGKKWNPPYRRFLLKI